MIIGGKIDSNGQSLKEISELIIEPKPESVLNKRGVIVAKAHINPNSQTIPLRVMNLTNQINDPHTPQDSVQSVSTRDLNNMPEHQNGMGSQCSLINPGAAGAFL